MVSHSIPFAPTLPPLGWGEGEEKRDMQTRIAA